MKLWIATLAAFFSYSQVVAAEQTPQQIQRLMARIALYPDAPVRRVSTHSMELAHRWMQQYSSLKMDQLAQPWDPSLSALTSPSVATNPSQNLSLAVGYVPAYNLSQVDGPPLMLFPGGAPVEGAFIGGLGVTFGVGFPVDYLSGVGLGGVNP
jgi:hypothetical protein